MSYGLYDYNRRRRRRFWSRLLTWLAMLVALAGIAGFSYTVGVEQVRSRADSLEQEVAAMAAARDKAEKRAAQLQQIAQTQEIRANELEIRLQREVPSGELAKLRDLLAKRIAEGVDPARLAFVIEQTGVRRACAPAEVKRFVLPTPVYKGANTQVAFAEGAVTVTGEGQPARNAAGNVEAWFDPTKPVTLTFTQADGQATSATGPLPLEHSVVVGDKEFRFIVNQGARSFVEVNGTRCPFP